ncbi:MAG TPA: aspartate 1-decarboxylase [Gemmatales bacterium]|nr:aspartate 1-decarboxylase [Gemmatales bacterium]
MLLRTYLLGKIHNIRLTDKNVNYVGSITLGPEFLKASGIQVNEAVQVVNVESGARFVTYVLPGGKPGECTLNGGAARLAELGDKLIIMAFGQSDKPIEPKVAMIGEQNKLLGVTSTTGGG